VVERAIKITTEDFRVQEGMRTRERQAESVARRLRNLRGVLMQIIQWPGHFWPLPNLAHRSGPSRDWRRAKIIERTTRGLRRLRMGEMSTVAVNLV
jgi:hypothetical protein